MDYQETHKIDCQTKSDWYLLVHGIKNGPCRRSARGIVIIDLQDWYADKNNLTMRRLAGSMRVGAHVNFKDG